MFNFIEEGYILQAIYYQNKNYPNKIDRSFVFRFGFYFDCLCISTYETESGFAISHIPINLFNLFNC